MKPASIVAAGKRFLADAIAQYIKDNPTPAGSKVKENIPPPAYERKIVNRFLSGHNLHESFVEAILQDDK